MRAPAGLRGGASADALADARFRGGDFLAADFLAGVSSIVVVVADESSAALVLLLAALFLAAVFFAADFLAGAFFDAARFSAMALLSQPLAGHQPVDQGILTFGRLVVTELARRPEGVDLLQLGPDRHRVVELILGLPPHLLGNRHHTTQRRHGSREKADEQTHQPLPTKS
jgi:hypothetical protein